MFSAVIDCRGNRHEKKLGSSYLSSTSYGIVLSFLRDVLPPARN